MGLMTFEEWLEELVTVDEEGGSPTDTKLPLVLMPRARVFAMRGYTDDVVQGMWKIYLAYDNNDLIKD